MNEHRQDNYTVEPTGYKVRRPDGKGFEFKDWDESSILNDRKPCVRIFEHMDEFWSYLEQPIGRKDKQGQSIKEHNSLGYAKAMKHATQGWPEGRKLIREHMAEIDKELGSCVVEPIPQYDVVGDEVDVGAYLAGQPEHMLNWQDGESKRRMVRIVVNTTWHGGMQEAMKKGAVACTIADLVDRYGWRSEIIAASAVSSRISWELYLTVKRFNEALNIDRIAFLIGSPDWDRFQIFRAEEQEVGRIGEGLWRGHFYGGANQLQASGRGDIYIGGQDDYTDAEGVIKALKQLGVKVKEDGWGK